VVVEDWRPTFFNGIELEDWQKGPTIIEYCREAGIRGWEIVSFALGQTGLSFEFKRQFGEYSILNRVGSSWRILYAILD
jgi:hypothetical protein